MQCYRLAARGVMGQAGRGAWFLGQKGVVLPAPAVQRAARGAHWSALRTFPACALQPGSNAGQQRAMSMSDVTPKEGTVTVTIIDPVTAKDGRQIQARIGASVLEVAQEHDMVRTCLPARSIHLCSHTYRLGSH